MAGRPEMHVIAGALFDAAGRVLIAQRPRGRHMAGRWEFPGGKLGSGEDRLEGLKRELAEELGVTVKTARPLIRLYHYYPDRRVLLDFWRVLSYEGTPQGLDSQALAWVKADELPGHDLLEADRGIVTALRMPQLAHVIAGPAQLAALGNTEPRTIFWHIAESPATQLDAAVVRGARAAGHRVFALGDGVEAIRIAALAGADGAVLRRHGQNLHVDRESAFLVGVVCEDEAGALEAIGEGAHFLVVAPHRGPMAQPELEQLCEAVGVPVFAGWYPDARRLERVQTVGAHGCAVITTKKTGA
ncbi:MAG: NUDIX domain-containing protein [Steroidobacteraceae bacterium]